MKKYWQVLKGLSIAIILLSLMFFLVGCVKKSAKQVPAIQEETIEIIGDSGALPWVIDIEEATISNANYQKAIWTGEKLQLVLMSLKPGEAIDMEKHGEHDQFIRIEQGEARIRMGLEVGKLIFDRIVTDDWAILIPAGYWHEIINTGNVDLKIYTVYAPREHEHGTLHKTYSEAAGDTLHHSDISE